MLLGNRQALSMTAGDHRDTGLYRLVSADTQFWPGGGGREKIETANSQWRRGGRFKNSGKMHPRQRAYPDTAPKRDLQVASMRTTTGRLKGSPALVCPRGSGVNAALRQICATLPSQAIRGAASGCARRQSGGKNSAGQVVSGIARDQENPSAFPGRQAAALYGRQGCLPPLRHPPQPAANAARNSTRNFGTTSNGSYGARPACRVSMGR